MKLQSSMVFRNSLLLSTLLTNNESWYSLTPKNVSDLEQVDEALLRKIMEAPAKTPVEALYLELGATPIRYLLMMRGILYALLFLTHKSTGPNKKSYCWNLGSSLSNFIKAPEPDIK